MIPYKTERVPVIIRLHRGICRYGVIKVNFSWKYTYFNTFISEATFKRLKQIQGLLPAAVPLADKAVIPYTVPAANYRAVPKDGVKSAPADRCCVLIAISEQIRTEIQQHNVGRLFAVVHLNGTQRKITAEDIIVLHKHISADIGEKIILNKVLMVGSKDFSIIGKPLVRYLKRQNNNKMKLRKDSLTYLRINAIRLGSLNDHL
ncbi:hypothetical protein LSH36_134g04038 [Paralvinella palmiformis]|uniref:Large ribosomal subunit protein bL21m n=1 Tax=Paralvinella palmiformis TaxID=53620 RepID=A0AAD9JVV4_9ANNE|nr:hypothetical protein LSH36_134g04038 [Paralvinella palmiformis]